MAVLRSRNSKEDGNANKIRKETGLCRRNCVSRLKIYLASKMKS